MTHPEYIKFSAQMGTKAALEKAAEADGVTLNDLLRDLASKEAARRGIPIVAVPSSKPLARPYRRRAATPAKAVA